LRDDGVSEGSKAVHPRGNPISHSTHVGFNIPPAALGRGIPFLPYCSAFDFLPESLRQSRAVGVGHSPRATAFTAIERSTVPFLPSGRRPVGLIPLRTPFPPFASLAAGVGHNPDSIPPVWCANGGSGNTVPFRVIPERRDFPEHLVQSASAKGDDVLDDDPRRPTLFDEPAVFAPQAGAGTVEPCAFTGDADVLAGESPANNVNWPDIVGVQVTHIAEAGHVRPVLAEHGSAIGVDLAERDCSHPGSLESEREAADSAEEVKYSHSDRCGMSRGWLRIAVFASAVRKGNVTFK
jgi:hypothetical protein